MKKIFYACCGLLLSGQCLGQMSDNVLLSKFNALNKSVKIGAESLSQSAPVEPAVIAYNYLPTELNVKGPMMTEDAREYWTMTPDLAALNYTKGEAQEKLKLWMSKMRAAGVNVDSGELLHYGEPTDPPYSYTFRIKYFGHELLALHADIGVPAAYATEAKARQAMNEQAAFLKRKGFRVVYPTVVRYFGDVGSGYGFYIYLMTGELAGSSVQYGNTFWYASVREAEAAANKYLETFKRAGISVLDAAPTTLSYSYFWQVNLPYGIFDLERKSYPGYGFGKEKAYVIRYVGRDCITKNEESVTQDMYQPKEVREQILNEALAKYRKKLESQGLMILEEQVKKYWGYDTMTMKCFNPR
ncbi:MAG: hypothetical protein PHF00_11280 [Elusimicrobia bacterium]|nr:hypothetical protein [Elusimicrobiota bacterium]